VQGWVADDTEKDEEFYETLTCTACNAALVNPETGNVLGDGEPDDCAGMRWSQWSRQD
jgi:hypothetical protein